MRSLVASASVSGGDGAAWGWWWGRGGAREWAAVEAAAEAAEEEEGRDAAWEAVCAGEGRDEFPPLWDL